MKEANETEEEDKEGREVVILKEMEIKENGKKEEGEGEEQIRVT